MTIYRLIRDTFVEAGRDQLYRLAAAIAFFAIFSMPALLVISVAVAGAAYGWETAQGQLVEEIQGVMGEQGAGLLRSVIERASAAGDESTLAKVLGIAALVIGATGAFVELQDALNEMWGGKAEPRRTGVAGYLFKRVLSFGLVLAVGFLLLVSLVLSAVVSAGRDLLARVLTEDLTSGVVQALDFAISMAVFTLLIGFLFKVLPDRKIPWKGIWVGATVTAALFVAGKLLFGIYLGAADLGSAYGTAGSLVLTLFWIYGSSLIVLLGAEFTKVYARSFAPPAPDGDLPFPPQQAAQTP